MSQTGDGGTSVWTAKDVENFMTNVTLKRMLKTAKTMFRSRQEPISREHGPMCDGPDEDGDWSCPISSKEPGPCLACLHKWGIERQMTLADTAPERIWYLCYMCAHGC